MAGELLGHRASGGLQGKVVREYYIHREHKVGGGGSKGA
jgi:hypothetical protein